MNETPPSAGREDEGRAAGAKQGPARKGKRRAKQAAAGERAGDGAERTGDVEAGAARSGGQAGEAGGQTADTRGQAGKASPSRPLADRLRDFWQTWIWRPAAPAAARQRAASGSAEAADATAPAPEPLPGTVYLVPISHLDTQWRWTVRDTVARFLPRTVRDNVAAFERFPSYRVNFDGAFRYQLLAEHHPADFALVRRWVEAGRWQVTGATWDALDVNLPAPESFVRHVLYGRRWFREHLGKDPRDLFLPDCFGFGAQVPVLAAHCGLVGFATSKLRRFDDMRSAFGIPFPLGWWEGADGSRLLSVLEPGGYGEPLSVPPAADPEAARQLDRHREILDEAIAVRFFGIGDKGGAPADKSLEQLAKAAADPGPVKTEAVGAAELLGRLARELPADRLPVYRGELLLSVHGTGCYTSQAGMKRWNSRNERLAAAAERAAAAAAWLGGCPYPAERLREAWKRFLWHQFHDDLTGTSIPAAYDVSWHDEAIAAGAFGEVLRSSVAAVARGLDTRAEGVGLVVFNPLPVARRELVAARLRWEPGAPVRVVGPDGAALPAQVEPGDAAAGDGLATLRFVADLPPLGFAVFDVRRGEGPGAADRELRCSPAGLETSRWRLMLDRDGNLSSLFDKRLDRELLGAPLRLELFADRSRRFPAWEIHWQDLEQGAVAAVEGPAEVRTLATGPAAVALEVRQRFKGSAFVTRYRLAAGDACDALEVELAVRWRTRGRLLKATLTAAAAGRDAVYDVGVTGVRRGPATPALYEVPAQAWADLPQDGNAFGVALLTERPHGFDHPLPHTLRMSLLHTPATGRRFPHQSFQDLGDHRFRFAVAGHRGDWCAADLPGLAERFRNPPLAFTVPAGEGPLGRSWSFLALEGGAQLAALKEHEEGGEWVARLLDPLGRGGTARLRLPAAVVASRELDGSEDPRESPAGEGAGGGGRAATENGRLAATAGDVEAAASGGGSRATDRRGGGALDVAMAPRRPAAVGFRLAAAATPLAPPRSAPVALPYHRAVVTAQGEPCGQGIGDGKVAIPAEQFPARVGSREVSFALAPAAEPAGQAVSCGGQRLVLPEGPWERLWLLAASGSGPRELAVRAGGEELRVTVPPALEPLARPDGVARFGVGPWALWRVRPGATLEAPVAWVAGHCHDARGRDLPYRPVCLFALSVPLPAGTREVVVADAPEVLLFAATVSAGAGDALAAWGEEPIRP